MKLDMQHFIPSATKKFFVVTFDSGERTRWIESDDRVRETLAILARTLGQTFTQGPEPRVTVHNYSNQQTKKK